MKSEMKEVTTGSKVYIFQETEKRDGIQFIKVLEETVVDYMYQTRSIDPETGMKLASIHLATEEVVYRPRLSKHSCFKIHNSDSFAFFGSSDEFWAWNKKRVAYQKACNAIESFLTDLDWENMDANNLKALDIEVVSKINSLK